MVLKLLLTSMLLSVKIVKVIWYVWNNAWNVRQAALKSVLLWDRQIGYTKYTYFIGQSNSMQQLKSNQR